MDLQLNANISVFNHRDQVMSTTPHIHNATTEYHRPFEDFHAVIIGIILFVLMVVGVVFNLVTILVIRSTPKLRNVFMQFIVSLCVSDMTSAIFSPLFWYRRTLGFEEWGLPEFFCKVYWGVELMTSYVTSLHIVSFAVLRCLSIQFPIAFNAISMKAAAVWISLLWLVSFVCGFIPLVILFGPEQRLRHSNNPDAKWPTCTVKLKKIETFITYQKIAFPIFFYVPIVLVIFLSLIIGVMVHVRAGNIPGLSVKNTEHRKRKEKQAFLQLFLIVICFLFGYLPFTAYQFWASESHPNTRYYQLFDYWFGVTEYICLRLSECLDPVFYNLGSSKMRHYSRRYLKEKIPSLSVLWRCGKKKTETPSRSSTSIRHSNSGGKNLEQADLGV